MGVLESNRMDEHISNMLAEAREPLLAETARLQVKQSGHLDQVMDAARMAMAGMSQTAGNIAVNDIQKPKDVDGISLA